MEILSTPDVGKMKHTKVLQIALKGVGEKSPIPLGEAGDRKFW